MSSVLIVAGENSGDQHGAALVEAFDRLAPGVTFFGVGGAHLQRAGVRLCVTLQDLAVMGIFEIVSHLPRIKRIYDRLKAEIRNQNPAAAVLIDSPDFNLRLARFLKKRKIPVLYYISPTVWAWRKRRLKLIRRTVAKMLLIFPFEESLYAEHGIPATFVGHPLLERIDTSRTRAEIEQKYGFDPRRPLVALLPGSREMEIKHHMPVVVAAARSLAEQNGAQFALLLAEGLPASAVRRYIPKEIEGTIRILDSDYFDALAASDLALSACGTANLEAALLETPLVAFYRISPLTYALGKPFVKINRYSIVNILAESDVAPELIQTQFTPENLTREAQQLLNSAARRDAMRSRFREIRQTLGGGPASRKAAQELKSILAASQEEKPAPGRPHTAYQV